MVTLNDPKNEPATAERLEELYKLTGWDVLLTIKQLTTEDDKGERHDNI
jgi:hypothetical protein